MVLTADSFDHNPPLECYIFTANVKGLGGDIRAQKSYLVKMYPCQSPIKVQDIAEIYVSKFVIFCNKNRILLLILNFLKNLDEVYI